MKMKHRVQRLVFRTKRLFQKLHFAWTVFNGRNSKYFALRVTMGAVKDFFFRRYYFYEHLEGIETVYVKLLEEGTPTIRSTRAIKLNDETYKILHTIDYDPEDEIWEFLPDSVVRCEKAMAGGNQVLLAVKKITDVFVNLLEEETPCFVRAQAIDMGNGLYQLLKPAHYDPEDKIWEFLPGAIVRCAEGTSVYKETLPMAIEQVGSAELPG